MLLSLTSIYEQTLSMATGVPASFREHNFLCLHCSRLSAVSYHLEFSSTTHSEHLPSLSFLTMCSCCHLKSSFYPLNLIPDQPHSLTQLYWLTNLSSPLTSLLLLSFPSGSFWANINADTHLSSHALFSLAVNGNHVQKNYPTRMSELQVNTQKLWNSRIKISSARNLI